MTTTEHDASGEQALVQQARTGSTEAFDALYDRHGERSWRFALAVSGTPNDAAAVVPQAFGNAFTALRGERTISPVPFGTRLLGAVRSTALDHRRDRGDDATGPSMTTASEDDRVVLRAFAQLPERWRSVLWLTVVEGMRPEQAAPVVGLAPDATAQLAARARLGLRQQFLKEHLATSGGRNCTRAMARLVSHADGQLSAADSEKLERHLRLCNRCAERDSQLREIDEGLRAVAWPMPVLLVDDVQAAWRAAVSAPAHRTATGLSPGAEKLLAGVSAIVAAAGVVGAAMLGARATETPSGDVAAPVASAADSDSAVRAPLDLDPGVDIPGIGRNTRLGTAGSASGRTDARTGSVVGLSDPSDAPTPAGDLGGDSGGTQPAPEPSTTQPRVTTPADDGSDDPAPTPPATSGDEPLLEVGTTVAGIPVAVEVGSDPGATVGPVSVGSEPQPEEKTDAETTEVVEPVAEVVEPAVDVVDTVDSGLGGL